MESQIAPVVYTNSSANNFFRKRHTVTASFAAGILLFLLPFAELKCSSMTLADNTGIGIALGTQWKVIMVGGADDFMKKAKESVKDEKKNPLQAGPNIFAIVSLVAAAIGIAFAFSNQKHRAMAGMSAGILAAIMLIAVMVQYKLAMKSALSDNSKGMMDVNMGMVLKVQFTMWYFLSLASFAAAAFFSYKHHVIEMEDAISKSVDFEFQEKKE
jgi:uncharacterized membrane protein